MWKPVHDPGPWSQFLKRKDIIGLPLKEAKRKFLKEQVEYNNYVSYVTANYLSAKSVPKGPQAPTELVSIPAFEGLLRYAGYNANTCTNPAIDVFVQDFGPEYISTDLSSPVVATAIGGGVAVQLNFTEALLPLNWIRFEFASYNSTTTVPPYVPTAGYVQVTLLEEFQGRPNVLKITKPPQFAGTQTLVLEISMETFIDNPVYDRQNYWDTHTWSYGIGIWAENPSITNNNFTFNGGGTADLLLGLSDYPNPSEWIENLGGYNANEWVDIRTLNKPIIQGDSDGKAWLNILNLSQGPIATDNPDALLGIGTYEENIYISDWNFRVCPI